MKKIVVLLLLSLLLSLAAGDAEEKVTIDPVLGIILQGLSNYTRIDKIANANTFSYQLINTGAEYLFPSLDIIFDVPFPQEVTFEYNIILQALTDDGWLATRVMIDDE